MDTYFVRARSEHDDKTVEEFLNEVDGASTFAGTCHVLNRKNSGLSFGSYSHAFESLRDKYDFFFFTEDDFITAKHHYLKICLERIEGNGFVAAKGIGTKWGRHAHGGIGLSSTSILQKVWDKHGKLPYYEGELKDPLRNRKDKKFDRATITPFIKHGEVAFTNEIEKLGYKIVSSGDLTWHMEKKGMNVP
jgi:hypothetical protein